ncbi:MAG: hypothetical protein ISQ34_05210 [Rickettsiales bacterium]|nr:hypothetical protein [Rickettsiales bacterium]
MAGNFLLAQQKIFQAIEIVFDGGFNIENQEHRDHLFTLAAIQKAQDQIIGGKDFISQRTRDFNKHFGISDNLAGKNIAGEIIAIPDAKKYLVQKFKLNNTIAKANVIIENQENVIKKAQDLIDLGFKDAVEPLVEIAQSTYKATPSLAVAGLTLGTAQMVLRAVGNQEAANQLRDNIGASTEAAAFFVLANGILENLSHSFILAAPAFATVAVYENIHPNLKRIYDYFILSSRQEQPLSESDQEFMDIETHGREQIEDVEGSFLASNKKENAINLLQKAKSFINEDEMWIGLQKHQLVYKDNSLENDLKIGIQNLIDAIEETPSHLNKLLQKDYNQTLRDSFEMLKAYADVCRDRNPGSGVDQFLDEFCDFFARDAILLSQPSQNAKMAAFSCKVHAGLVSFEERIKESLPHIPTGQQVLLAATVIGSLYSASAIYKSVTGEEEAYSEYVTNFPDHLFQWLQLEEMYQNMGGGAQITEVFKDFFAGFNLAENSTHLGIVVAPFFAYSQMGSKMFENAIHSPLNYLAYIADAASSYASSLGNWFGKKNTVVAPQIDLQSDDLENIDIKIEIEEIPTKNSAEIGTQTEEKSSEENATLYCGSAQDLFAQQKQLSTKPQSPLLGKFRSHIHGPNCKH